RRAGGEERLARNDLEGVAALEGLAREADQGGIFPALVVGATGHASGPDVRLGGPSPQKAPGRAARDLELVTPAHCDLAPMVDDDQLVWEIQNKIALFGRSLEAPADRLELKRQVVAEGAVEAEVRLVRVMEEGAERAQEREHRRLPTALLLGESACGRSHCAVQPLLGGRHPLDGVERAERPGDRGQKDAPARVQRLEAEAATPRGEDERGVDESHVPTRVAPRVLVARGQQRAPMRVERLDNGLDRVRDRDFLDRSVNADPAHRVVGGRDHGLASSVRGAGRRGATSKRKPPRWGGSVFLSAYGSRARARRGRPQGRATTTASARPSRS